MSRSALLRQEAGVKEREREATEIFSEAVAEGRQNQRSKGIVPLYGPDDTFNINAILLQSIILSPYFSKCCQEINDWNSLVDEIYYEVKHVEPWVAGKVSVSHACPC
jgi:pre-mRNA-splicing factor 38B